jgi:hypothetical protein
MSMTSASWQLLMKVAETAAEKAAREKREKDQALSKEKARGRPYSEGEKREKSFQGYRCDLGANGQQKYAGFLGAIAKAVKRAPKPPVAPVVQTAAPALQSTMPALQQLGPKALAKQIVRQAAKPAGRAAVGAGALGSAYAIGDKGSRLMDQETAQLVPGAEQASNVEALANRRARETSAWQAKKQQAALEAQQAAEAAARRAPVVPYEQAYNENLQPTLGTPKLGPGKDEFDVVSAYDQYVKPYLPESTEGKVGLGAGILAAPWLMSTLLGDGGRSNRRRRRHDDEEDSWF